MINITEIAFCCYAVTDVPRARAFYEGVLGLKPAQVKYGKELEAAPDCLPSGWAAVLYLLNLR